MTYFFKNNPTMKQLRRLPAYALITTIMMGCSSLQTPTAEVVSIERGPRSDQGAVVNVTVRMANPNDVQLPVHETTYRVELDGAKEIFELTFHPPVTMPVSGEQLVTFPAAFAIKQDDLTGRRVAVSGSIHYQPPGEIRQVLTDMKFPLPHIAFRADTALD